jgi:hypothetical protein
MVHMRRTILALLLVAASSCGTIVGQIPVSTPGSTSAIVSLDAAQDVLFWSDFAAHYDNYDDVDYAAYQIELVQDGAVVASLRCRPRDYLYCIHKYHGFHWYDVNCRMACTATVPKSGPTEVRATLSAPPSMQIERANLVVRQ